MSELDDCKSAVVASVCLSGMLKHIFQTLLVVKQCTLDEFMKICCFLCEFICFFTFCQLLQKHIK